MKNKILMAGVLAMIFAIAGNVYAIGGPNINKGTGDQVQQQTQTINQGENSQIKTQNSEQTQSDDAVKQNSLEIESQVQRLELEGSLELESQVQQKNQTQEKLQDGSEVGIQVQNQNQIKNQGETNQIQNKEQEGTQKQDKGESATAVQRRSDVANAVQEMLQVADRNGGIGQQVRIIAQTQTQNQEKIEASLQKVQSRSGFAKFFVGPNYGEINKTQKILEQNREQIKQLNQTEDQLTNQGDQQILTEQVQYLEQANTEIENLLNVSRKGFSLFGWMFRLFSK